MVRAISNEIADRVAFWRGVRVETDAERQVG